jgi:hypothetical protein
MSKTISFFCALAIGVIAPFTLQPGPAGAVPVVGDLDGDLTGGVADCAPLDPSVHPGAPDRPDLAFADTNCDGIDGNAVKAVFVSTVDGNDAGTGTKNNPLKTITAGINAAAPAGKDVYVAGGTYSGPVNLADDVSVYGGYELGFLNRSADEVTTINGVNGPAAIAVGDTGVVLQMLALHGTRDFEGNSYGFRAVPEGTTASQVLLEKVDVTAEAAGAPRNGASGGTGATGAGLAGGAGGPGSCVTGVIGAPGNFGLGSGVGSPGGTGANGTVVAQAGTTWLRQQAQNGQSGGLGGGGRGGTGGAGDNNFGVAVCGGQGGSGGSGGGGGGGGTGGFGGGGSFGVYAYNSSIVASNSPITSGNGGDGGNGGLGGPGGFGALGSPGAVGSCLTIFVTVCAQNGFQGQQGSQGGHGGGGGGGVGGPSAAVYQGGGSSGFTQDPNTTTTPGTAGLGGFQGGGSVRAPSGVSVPVLRTAGAPVTSTYDFDGDTVLDPDDACPADPGLADANADGCPESPQTSITSGPKNNGYLLDTQTSIGLGSSEAGTVACSLDGGDADTCTTPRALTGLVAGTHVFKAWATDGAGFADPTAATRAFTVPVNNTALTASSGWTKKTGSGYFRNTYSTTTKQGATLSTPVSDALRVALVATKAPGQGKVNIMLGKTLLKQVNLSSTTTKKKQVFEQEFASATSGTIKLVVATSGKPVKIEGLGVVTQ